MCLSFKVLTALQSVALRELYEDPAQDPDGELHPLCWFLWQHRPLLMSWPCLGASVPVEALDGSTFQICLWAVIFLLSGVLCLDLWQLLGLLPSFGHQRWLFNGLLPILSCLIDLPSLTLCLIISSESGSRNFPYLESIAQFSTFKVFIKWQERERYLSHFDILRV